MVFYIFYSLLSFLNVNKKSRLLGGYEKNGINNVNTSRKKFQNYCK